MNPEASRKIKSVLERILEEHYLGAEVANSLDLKVDPLLEGTDIDKEHFVRILEGLKEADVIASFVFWKGTKISYALPNYDFDLCAIRLPVGFRARANTYLKPTLAEQSSVREIELKLSLEEVKGQLYLIGDSKKKRIRISDDTDSRQAKLLKTLSFPDFGTFKTIESVAEAIKLPKDALSSSEPDQKTLITNTFKEINRTLSREGAGTTFRLKWEGYSVALIAISG